MGKPNVKLLMVTTDNNNKFYDMHDNNDGTFTAHWGRVGTDGKDTVYPISKWDSTYKSKVKKGYKDVTSNTAKICEYAPISDSEINTLLNNFLENSRQYVSHFTESTAISDEAAKEAQDHINAMVKNMEIANPNDNTLDDFNGELLQLFEIIPRKMSKVQNSLCTSLTSRASHIAREQSLLDNLINMTKNLPTSSGTQTIEDAFGFTIAKCTPEEIKYITDKLAKDGFYRYKFHRAWKICTPAREKGFKEYLKKNNLTDNDKNVKMYWHGTGSENILSILATGLLTKPANASYTGSMFGNGIYNAPNADKAAGYTSISGSYWKRGSNKTAYLFINAVIMGKKFDTNDNYTKYGSTPIRNLDEKKMLAENLGYHSVYAHAGSSLRRDEVIVYNENQVACRYLVEFII